MKKTALFFVLTTLSISQSFSQTTDELDKKDGFQNFKFNTPLSDYQRYKPVKTKDGHYELTNISDVTIGDYGLEIGRAHV